MNHRAAACTSPPSGHPGCVLRRAGERVLFAWMFVLACVVLGLAGDRFEDDN